MKSQYRVVVIGGGVVGASVLYHLSKSGWSDVAINREEIVLTERAVWHASGGVPTRLTTPAPNRRACKPTPSNPLAEIERETPRPSHRAFNMTGVAWRATPERWEWLQGLNRTFQPIGIERLATC